MYFTNCALVHYHPTSFCIDVKTLKINMLEKNEFSPCHYYFAETRGMPQTPEYRNILVLWRTMRLCFKYCKLGIKTFFNDRLKKHLHCIHRQQFC